MRIFTQEETASFRHEFNLEAQANPVRNGALIDMSQRGGRESDNLIEAVMVGASVAMLASEKADISAVAKGCVTPSRRMLLRGLRVIADSAIFSEHIGKRDDRVVRSHIVNFAKGAIIMSPLCA